MRRVAPYNVVAAFRPRPDGTIPALDGLIRRGIPASAITVHQPGDGWTVDEFAEMEGEMQDELNASWGVAPGPQVTTALSWAVVLGMSGVMIGLLAGALWAGGFGSPLGRLVRLAIPVVVLGVAGATVGLVVGGGNLDSPHGEERDTGVQPVVAERDVLVAVHVEDPALVGHTAAVLREFGAERVHFVGGDGVPLPPQAAHPRPADPEDYWWTNAREG